jgi:serine/threonine-protein kinase
MIGEKLGKYKVVGTLGTGSMGTVYRAKDPDTDAAVAIKVISSNVLYDIEQRERFLRCVLPAAGLAHRAICPILELGDDEDDFFVVMPLLDGKRLDQRLKQGPFEWREAVDVAIGICDALAAGHAAGAAHRGLKPANVWLRRDGGVTLSDFAVARFTEIEQSPRASHRGPRSESFLPASALAYMAPEQIRGDAVSFQTDFFSLGVILYEMVTGVHPFESRNSLSRMSAILEATPLRAGAMGSAVPRELDLVLERLLAKDSRGRPASAAELSGELQRVRDHADLPVTAPPAAPEGRDSGRRRAWAIGLIVAILASLALAAVWAGWLRARGAGRSAGFRLSGPELHLRRDDAGAAREQFTASRSIGFVSNRLDTPG